MHNLDSTLRKALESAHEIFTWYTLIADAQTYSNVASLLSVGDLKRLGALLVLRLEEPRDPLPEAPAVYILRSNKLQLMYDDIAKNLYAGYIIILTSFVQDINHIADAISSLNMANRVYGCYEISLDWYFEAPMIFSTGQKNSFSMIFGKDSTNDTLVLGELDIMAQRLTSFILSIADSENHQIILPKSVSRPSRHLGLKVQGALRVQSRNTSRSKLNILFAGRLTDLGVLLSHNTGFLSLLHELFTIESGKLCLPDRNVGLNTMAQVLREDLSTLDLNDVIQHIHQDLLKVHKDLREAKTSGDSMSIATLTVSKEILDMMTTLGSKVLTQIEEKNYGTFISIEKDIFKGRFEAALNSLRGIAKRDVDFARTALLLCVESQGQFNSKVSSLFEQNSPYVQIIRMLSDLRTQGAIGAGTAPESSLFGAVSKMLQGKRVFGLESLINSLISMKLPHDYESLGKSSDCDGYVVFVIGGGNYYEGSLLFRRFKKNLYYGSSEMLNGSTFLDQV